MELDHKPSVEELKVAAWREARRDGVFAGLTSALAGALVGSKLMGFGRNKTIISGTLTGLLSGYFFTQAFLSSNMVRMRSKSVSSDTETDPWPHE
ncbi:uncharacterized protein EDB91DRAFT_318670 [Suillus paluster]|uniref:uncharacterized protein n=1 Tax=Suillus paluster TaxID=48578 RepID=UPI001B87C425|nr:uncharacterized protein EDB91DRAFT_318670 [Suillus paluster]KAG1741873.1 hypothetical protein EDB91DRAFT_318670 [Suillus paluster]